MKENKKLIVSKFPLKGVFEFNSQMNFLSPIVKGDKFWFDINLRANCWRDSHSTFILQIRASKYNLEEAKEFAEKIYKREITSPIIRARAIIPDVAVRGSVIRCFYAPQGELREQFENDPKKRVIEIIKGVDEKNTNFDNLNEDKKLIAYLPVTCSSRTGMNWETNFLFINYKR